MKIESRDEGDVKVVGLEGDLDTGSSPDVEKFLKELIEGGATKIVLDFDKLEYTSSAGLRIMLATAKRLSSAGGALHLCCLNEDVNEVFDMSGFSTLLNVFKTLDEALGGL